MCMRVSCQLLQCTSIIYSRKFSFSIYLFPFCIFLLDLTQFENPHSIYIFICSVLLALGTLAFKFGSPFPNFLGFASELSVMHAFEHHFSTSLNFLFSMFVYFRRYKRPFAIQNDDENRKIFFIDYLFQSKKSLKKDFFTGLVCQSCRLLLLPLLFTKGM